MPEECEGPSEVLYVLFVAILILCRLRTVRLVQHVPSTGLRWQSAGDSLQGLQPPSMPGFRKHVMGGSIEGANID